MNSKLGLIQFYEQLLVIEIILYPLETSNRFFDKLIKIDGMTEGEAGNIP